MSTCGPDVSIPISVSIDPSFADASGAKLHAATDDGHLVIEVLWVGPRSSSGTELQEVELDGTVVAIDPADPTGHTLFARSDASTWRSATTEFEGEPIVAGDVLYVPHPYFDTASHTDVAVFDADGCGAPSCSAITTLPTSTSGGIYGMAVTGGTLFAHTAGPPAELIAYRP